MKNEYPYLELGKEVLERLNSLEVIYPINVHEWRHYKSMINSYLIIIEDDPDKYLTRYYNTLVENTNLAIEYIESWLKQNVTG